jgi:hypothetical protein
MSAPTKRPAFPGLQLRPADRKVLAAQTRDGRPVSARVWKRIRILELLHEDWTIDQRREEQPHTPLRLSRGTPSPDSAGW